MIITFRIKWNSNRTQIELKPDHILSPKSHFKIYTIFSINDIVSIDRLQVAQVQTKCQNTNQVPGFHDLNQVSRPKPVSRILWSKLGAKVQTRFHDPNKISPSKPGSNTQFGRIRVHIVTTRITRRYTWCTSHDWRPHLVMTMKIDTIMTITLRTS